jgi:hypothetical protein
LQKSEPRRAERSEATADEPYEMPTYVPPSKQLTSRGGPADAAEIGDNMPVSGCAFTSDQTWAAVLPLSSDGERARFS